MIYTMEELKQFYARCHSPNTALQVSTLTHVVGYNGDDLASLLTSYTHENLYFLAGVDPLKQQATPHLRQIADRDILQKRYVFFDFDIRKDAEARGETLSNDEIVWLAGEFAFRLQKHPLLSTWSYIVFTGNGLHLYYCGESFPVDIPSYRLAYADWAHRLGLLLPYAPDKACKNPSRIARMPGSYNNKHGQHTLVYIIATGLPTPSPLVHHILTYRAPMKTVTTKDVIDFVHKTPIRECLTKLGYTIRPDDYLELIPGEKSSVKINDQLNYVNRFSGKAGSGDLLKFVMGEKNITFHDAVSLVAHELMHADVAVSEQRKEAMTVTRTKRLPDFMGHYLKPQPVNNKTWGLQHLDERFDRPRDGDFVLFLGEAGVGKCHGKGTKIMMADCSVKNVEDIQKGDMVMGDDSTPRTVLALGRGTDQMYRIIPNRNKNESFTCNSAHILVLRKEGTTEECHVSVAEYLNWNKTKQKKWKLFRAPLMFQEQKLETDPYILGVWLGDGTSSTSVINNPDPEIFTACRNYARQKGYIARKMNRKTCPQISMSLGQYVNDNKRHSFMAELRKLNLINNKHIPEIYLQNTTENRLSLLAGILDTDGHLSKHTFEITLKNKRLAEQVKWLASSLGFHASMKEKVGRIASTGFEGLYYRIHISGNLSLIPTRVKRKQAQTYKGRVNVLNTGFVIEPLGEGDYYGFTLDGNHRYLLDNFIVTHNTSFAIYSACVNARAGVKTLFLSFEMATQNLLTRYIDTRAMVTEDQKIYAKYDPDQIEVIREVVAEINNENLTWIDMRDVSDTKNWDLVKALMEDYDLIYIDNFSRIVPRDKEETTVQSHISENLSNYVESTGKTIIMIHHYAKSNTPGGKRGLEARGSQKLIDDISIHVSISRDVMMELYEEGANYMDFSVRKNRYGKTGTAQIKWDNGKYH